MTTHFRGHDVVDTENRLIGTIEDVIYDVAGEPTWAVVDLGLLHSSHYLPVAAGYLTDDGNFVVPYDKRTVKSAPRAPRNHVMEPDTEIELQNYWELAS
ncbi:MAG: PRC-barrel domain-containing protein [Ilumatobacteraceae bacterium]